MNPFLRNVVGCTIAGFVSALLTDIHAWRKSNGEKFDWGLAFKRWANGAMNGLLVGLGISNAS